MAYVLIDGKIDGKRRAPEWTCGVITGDREAVSPSS